MRQVGAPLEVHLQLPGICFWREDRGNAGWAEYMREEGGSHSIPNFLAFVAANGGQIEWSRGMVKQSAGFGITVNMVAPGWLPVECHENDLQEMKDNYRSQIPAGSWGTPVDVANAVRFFLPRNLHSSLGKHLTLMEGGEPHGRFLCSGPTA